MLKTTVKLVKYYIYETLSATVHQSTFQNLKWGKNILAPTETE